MNGAARGRGKSHGRAETRRPIDDGPPVRPGGAGGAAANGGLESMTAHASGAPGGDLECHPLNPFRPVDWRWRRAAMPPARSRGRSRLDDAWVRRARHHLAGQAGRIAVDRAMLDLFKHKKRNRAPVRHR
jgi:hypothetical protein